MSDSLTDDEDGATPLTPQEREGLIPTYITQRRELNEVEHAGVLEADRWAFARRRKILDTKLLAGLHERMFGQVWRWAGKLRTSERNIGVEPWRIAPDLRQLVDDVGWWIEHETYPPDEIAIRFHHRLVAIHPFANGNGRHARLAADILAVQLGRERFSWGGGDLVEPAQLRRRYIAALRAADRHDLAPLLQFARS